MIRDTKMKAMKGFVLVPVATILCLGPLGCASEPSANVPRIWDGFSTELAFEKKD